MSKVALSGNASGTGTFTIASPNGNTDRTINLPDSNGTILTTATAGVPVNGPAFSAYSSSAQSINSNTTSKIQLNVEVFDTNSNFDPTTNYRFTPTVAGYYQINGQIALQGSAAGYARSAIFKNGTNYAEGASSPNNTITGAEASVAAIVYMNGSTDYVELYCYMYTGAGALNLQNSSAVNYFSGALIRSAT